MKPKRYLALPFVMAALPLFAQQEPTPAPGQPALPAAETDPAVIKTDSSYGFGFNSGMTFRQQMSRFGVTANDINTEEFTKGLMDAINGAETATDQEKINAAMLGLQNQIVEREKIVAEDNLKAAEAFLAENKGRDGVTTTESGLQYEVLKAGEGESYNGAENAQFMVNYKGTLIDGTEFDASPEGSPVPMNLNVVPGFREALSTMPAGSKWKIFLKPDLAYGDQRRSEEIGPNSALIFEVELEEIVLPPAPAPRPKAVSPPVEIPPAPKKTEE